MALLDELLAKLQGAQTPWAQEFSRRQSMGQDTGSIDADLADQQARAQVARQIQLNRQSQEAAKTTMPREVLPPTADPFDRQASVVSGARDLDLRAPQDMGPQDFAARPSSEPAGARPAYEAPSGAPAQIARPAPPQTVRSSPAPEGRPDFSSSPLEGVSKALGLDKLGIGGNDEKAKMRQATYDLVLQRTGSKQNAELAARDPRIFMAMLPSLQGRKDEWKVTKVAEDENGRAIFGRYNERTGEVTPIQMGGLPTIQGPMQMGPQGLTPGGGGGGVASPAPVAPGAAPGAPAADPAAAAAPAPAPSSVAMPVIPPPPPGVNPVEWRKEMAKKLADDQVTQVAKDREKKIAAGRIKGALEKLVQFPEEFGKEAMERAMGPLASDKEGVGEGSGGLWGSGLSIGSLARGAAKLSGEAQEKAFGGAAPTEVRDRIESNLKDVAAVMKPMVRAPGEGVWTDKDQENLEAQIGALTRAKTVDEYNRRLGDIHDKMTKVWGMELNGLKRPETVPIERPKTIGEAVGGAGEAIIGAARGFDSWVDEKIGTKALRQKLGLE